MSLTSFSSETAGDSFDAEIGTDPNVGHLSVLPDDDGDVEVPFGLGLRPGLDNFDPDPSQLAGRVVDTDPGVPSFARETTGIESVRATPPQHLQPTNPVSAGFIRTSILGLGLEQPAAETILSKPRPSAPVPEIHPAAPEIAPVVASPVAKKAPRKTARPKTRRRWRPHVSLQALTVALLTIGAVLEAGWIGLNIARSLSQSPVPLDAAGAAALPPQGSEQAVRQRQVAGTSGAISRVPSSSATAAPAGVPAAVRARPAVTSTGPVWVLITTRVPVEILEGGRRVGTSWGGGLRLAPGTHDLLVVNRATGADAHHTVDVVRGKRMSLAVQLVEGRLHVETRLSE